MNQILVAAIYAVVGIVVLPTVFSIFKKQYVWLDIILASGISAASSLIPTIGGPISILVMIVVLYWRLDAEIFPDIIVAVAVARLALVPALMLVQHA